MELRSPNPSHLTEPRDSVRYVVHDCFHFPTEVRALESYVASLQESGAQPYGNYRKNREELQQPAFHAIEKLEYEESFGILASIRAISKLMAVTGVADFSTMDIFKSESKRTITNLSATINLLKFRKSMQLCRDVYSSQ